MRAALAHRGSILAPLGPGWRRELDVIRETRALVPLLMDDAAALQVQICVRAARALGGEMAEAGVLMGGSARLICEAKGDVPLHLFDVFETFQERPVPSNPGRGTAVSRHFGRVHGVRSMVERLLAQYENVQLHSGLFPESVPPGLADTKFSFVHIDFVLPGCIADALAFFHPRMVAGGIILGDDYEDGEVRATFAAYFEPLRDTRIELPWGQVMVVKQE